MKNSGLCERIFELTEKEGEALAKKARLNTLKVIKDVEERHNRAENSTLKFPQRVE